MVAAAYSPVKKDWNFTINSQHNGPVHVDSVTVSREESKDGGSEFDAFGGPEWHSQARGD